MTQQVINIGTQANDSTGDPLRTAFDKVNDNFTELYDRHYLSAYDSRTQLNPVGGAMNIMTIANTSISNGISVQNNTQIQVSRAGVYNIQFSAQVDRDANGTDTLDIWLRKNNANVAWSAGHVTVSGTAAAARIVAAWNYVEAGSANDYFELAWSSDSTAIRLLADEPSAHPGVPSLIVTMVQI